MTADIAFRQQMTHSRHPPIREFEREPPLAFLSCPIIKRRILYLRAARRDKVAHG